MYKICLQAGHQHIQYNSIANLHGSTGAPSELSFNVDIRDKVAAELRSAGFDVTTTDANANDDPAITQTDFDLFLSIHYDADVYTTGGGFADYPAPATDGASVESQRICAIFNNIYFSTTGIVCVPTRSNPNTRFYYVWQYLTAKTPCVLLECGVGMHVPNDHQTLHFNRPLVVKGIVDSICKAFNVQQSPAPVTDIGHGASSVAYPSTETPEQIAEKLLLKIREIVDEVPKGWMERVLGDLFKMQKIRDILK